MKLIIRERKSGIIQLATRTDRTVEEVWLVIHGMAERLEDVVAVNLTADNCMAQVNYEWRGQQLLIQAPCEFINPGASAPYTIEDKAKAIFTRAHEYAGNYSEDQPDGFDAETVKKILEEQR
jgi:hypothetical protein